jgi:Flp pilus assembly protein TadG
MDRPLIRHRRRGDAIVEFALLAPLLVMILFGVMELGRVVDAWVVVHNAAREGARAGAAAYLGQDPATLAQAAANAYLASGFAGRADLATQPAVPPSAITITSDDVTVTAEAQVQIYSPMFQAMVGSPVHVRATADMRRQ